MIKYCVTIPEYPTILRRAITIIDFIAFLEDQKLYLLIEYKYFI